MAASHMKSLGVFCKWSFLLQSFPADSLVRPETMPFLYLTHHLRLAPSFLDLQTCPELTIMDSSHPGNCMVEAMFGTGSVAAAHVEQQTQAGLSLPTKTPSMFQPQSLSLFHPFQLHSYVFEAKTSSFGPGRGQTGVRFTWQTANDGIWMACASTPKI